MARKRQERSGIGSRTGSQRGVESEANARWSRSSCAGSSLTRGTRALGFAQWHRRGIPSLRSGLVGFRRPSGRLVRGVGDPGLRPGLGTFAPPGPGVVGATCALCTVVGVSPFQGLGWWGLGTQGGAVLAIDVLADALGV